MTTKKCSKCERALPQSAFAKKGNGLQARCRECHSEYTKAHYRKNKQYYKDKARKHHKSMWEFVNSVKSGNPCHDCKGFYPYYVMDFDHVRGAKLAEISYLVRTAASRARITKEIEKCELVCANCHRIRTYMRAKDMHP